MIINQTPLRVSFFGGSTDNPAFIKKYKKSIVINLASSLRTYSAFFKDKYGFNSQFQNYILNYRKREVVLNVNLIKNDVIRECLKKHNITPVSVYLTSDIFSTGSGLASSSSYIISLLKCIYKYKNITKSNYNLIKEALMIERKFNKFCGYQDPFGCAIPGIKLISTEDDNEYSIRQLSTDIFKTYNLYLLPSFIDRNSQEILQSLSKQLDLIYPIYEVAKEAEKLFLNKKYLKFFKLMKVSWDLKKKSSNQIIKNSKLTKIDNLLERDKDIVSHKLLGAGFGGSFLIVSKKKKPYNTL